MDKDVNVFLGLINGKEAFTELGDIVRIDADTDSMDLVIRTICTQFVEHSDLKDDKTKEHTLIGTKAIKTWLALKTYFPHLLTDRCFRHTKLLTASEAFIPKDNSQSA